MFIRCFVESQLPQSATLCRHHEQPHDVSVTPSVSHLQSSTPPLIQWLQALFAPLLTEGVIACRKGAAMVALRGGQLCDCGM